MKIINRTNITNALTNNYIKNETGILPMMVTNPVILVDWYHINRDRSELLEGLGIPAGSVIGPESTIVFDKITNAPVGGIDNLLMQSTYDDGEGGWTTEYSANGFVFANTVNVTENDYFVVHTNFNEKKKIIFKVVEHKRDHVKNLSIIEFDYSLAYDQEEKYLQLENQVVRSFTCVSSKVGPDSSFIIEENKLLSLHEEVQKYIDITEMYKDLFYDSTVGNFFYRIPLNGSHIYLHDRVFTKILANNEIIFFDNLISFARAEFGDSTELLMSEYDSGVSNHSITCSAIQQVLNGVIKDKIILRQPDFKHMSPHIAKYQKARMIYADKYTNTGGDTINILDFTGDYIDVDLTSLYVFDEDFIARLKNNNKYLDNDLRNVIIDIYNETEINMDDIELEYESSIDNFYLIPIILHEYSKRIRNIIT